MDEFYFQVTGYPANASPLALQKFNAISLLRRVVPPLAEYVQDFFFTAFCRDAGRARIILNGNPEREQAVGPDLNLQLPH
jgi:hypothetical protein